MDKIVLNGMSFYAYHGVSEAERQIGHRFQVDAEIFLDLRPAGASDAIEDTVNYQNIYESINSVITGSRFYLLERLAEVIAGNILSNQLVEKVVVRVKKVEPPIPGQVKSAGVEIDRRRTP